MESSNQVGQLKADEIPFGITFPLLVPDFVIELRSKSDSLTVLREKMEEYRSLTFNTTYQADCDWGSFCGTKQ
jgi:Putative restriction endonuclease